MPEDSSISDDPGTILDSYHSAVRPVPPATPRAAPPARHIAPTADEVLYTSPYRWKAPQILICDDGSLEEGETVYLRSEKIVIGRTKGDILIGHDVAMSGSHAEISRKVSGGKHAWVLRDLGSSNGTLARARTVALNPGTTILIGSKRYRFESPGSTNLPTHSGDEPGTTLMTDLASTPTDALPALVESIGPGSTTASRHPIRSTRVKIGRPGYGNDIEIDDLCLAGTHAIVARDVSGLWHLEAERSLNGVWVKVDAIRLTDNCMFQCGEQRFLFRV